MPETERRRRELAEEIVGVGHRLHSAGLIGGLAGNFSARLDHDRILITPTGEHKGTLTVGAILEVPLDALPQHAAAASSEFPFHRDSYRAHEDVGAVVHTHAPALVACGLRNLTISEYLPEVSLATAAIVTIPLLDSGSDELGKAVGEAVSSGAGVVLLRNHGAVAVGTNVAQAAYRMELAELAAYAVLLGVDGGGAVVAERVQRLVASS
jgi:ribulose-5-phosphate 4-epimerase/fuculose-1-phosphate aldolase